VIRVPCCDLCGEDCPYTWVLFAFSLRSKLCGPLSPLALEPLRESRPAVGAGIAALPLVLLVDVLVLPKATSAWSSFSRCCSSQIRM
jgi:hypothetical protein